MRCLCLFIGLLALSLFGGELCSAGVITDARQFDAPAGELVGTDSQTLPPAVSGVEAEQIELSSASLGPQVSQAIVAPPTSRLGLLCALALTNRQHAANLPPFWTPPDRPA